MFTRTRTRIEAAAPFPPISIVRVGDALGDRTGVDIAVIDLPGIPVGRFRIGGG